MKDEELLDHFAGQALNAMLQGVGGPQNKDFSHFEKPEETRRLVAHMAYDYAKAMVEAKNKQMSSSDQELVMYEMQEEVFSDPKLKGHTVFDYDEPFNKWNGGKGFIEGVQKLRQWE